MEFLIRELFVLAIQAQRFEFDSHDIERHFYFNNQRELVRELNKNVNAGTLPFTETCRQIGMMLSRMGDLIERIGDAESPTFSGEVRTCARWRRRTPVQP